MQTTDSSSSSSSKNTVPFPIQTRHVARSIAGFPTEVCSSTQSTDKFKGENGNVDGHLLLLQILLQVFSDRTLCLLMQGKVGRMVSELALLGACPDFASSCRSVRLSVGAVAGGHGHSSTTTTTIMSEKR